MILVKKILLPYLFLLPFGTILAQDATTKSLEVQVRVVEQLKGSVKSVPNIPLRLVGVGECVANETGTCSFTVPLFEYNRFDKQLEVEIKLKDYQVINPLDGILLLDTTQTSIKLEVIVIGEDLEEEYRSKIQALQNKLHRLKKENDLSLNRLNAMNSALLNNLKEGEQQKAALENSLAKLKVKAEADASENASLKIELERAQQELDNLKKTLEATQNDLAIALEEKYLRQQKYLKAISADLKDYMIRTKDVHQLLDHIKEYFPSSNNPSFVATYNSTLNAYNTILTSLNEQHVDYINNVKHYWQNPEVAVELKETFEILFDQLHYPQLQPAFSEINTLIRRNKAAKADNFAHETHHTLEPLIYNLEKSINRALAALENNFE